MPLAFLLAAVGVLLIAYVFVRLCQYFHHAGSVYAFVGATLGPRAGVVAGVGADGHIRLLRRGHVDGVRASSARRSSTASAIWTEPADVGAVRRRRLALRWRCSLAVVPGAARHEGAAGRRGHHGRAHPADRASSSCAGWSAGNAPGDGTPSTSRVFTVPRGHRHLDAVPRRGVRASCPSPGSRPPRRWARRPATRAATSPAPSSAPRSSAASTSSSSPPIEMMGFGTDTRASRRSSLRLAAGRPRHVVRRRLGRRPDHPRRRGQRLRLLPGLHGRRLAAAVRAGPRPGAGARARPHRCRAAPRRGGASSSPCWWRSSR